MATDENGSDLDVFEGLTKKGGGGSQPSAPPPPPRDGSRTLLGVTSPAAMPVAAPASPGTSSLPPPPPGRTSLPPVAPASPAEVGARPGGVDVDWDDEDEATQIFDKDGDLPLIRRGAPLPAAGTPPPSAPLKATLLGIMAPPSGGTGRFSPPPPGPSSRSSIPGALPPPGVGTLPPPPPAMLQGLGSTLSRSLPPPPGMPISTPPLTALPAPGTTLPPARPGAVSGQPPIRSLEATALLRPGQAPMGRWGWIGLAAAAVVGIVMFLVPHTGRIVVNVTDPKGSAVGRVDIYVDGRKQCDTAPCIVEQQSTGTHEVKVVADGYDVPTSQGLTVEWRKDVQATFLLGASTKGTGIRVGGTQPGVKLYVDDKEIGPLPQDYREMSPGDHVVKIVGSERYQPLERRVSLEKDKVEDLGTVTLKVVKGKVTITLATPGARVFLVSGTDRREIQTLPISVDIETAKNWSLQASRPGYTDYNQAISFDDGQAEKTYVVSLDPRTGQPAANAWAPPPQPQFGASPLPMAPKPVALPLTGGPAPLFNPPPAAQHVGAPAPAQAPAAAATPAAAAGAGGASESFLNINSIPPSTAFLDGKQLGPTPRVHVSVSPGMHQVKFVNAEQQLTKTISVSVGAGQTQMAVAKLSP